MHTLCHDFATYACLYAIDSAIFTMFSMAPLLLFMPRAAAHCIMLYASLRYVIASYTAGARLAMLRYADDERVRWRCVIVASDADAPALRVTHVMLVSALCAIYYF